jgi:hypothetical protein
MKSDRWKWAVATGAALAGGWTYDFPPCGDSSYVWHHRIDSIEEAYLAQHDTVAYMAAVYGPKFGLYPEELKVPSSIVLYYSKVFTYGRVSRIEPFMDEGQEGRCLLYIEVEECFYGDCGDTLKLFAPAAPPCLEDCLAHLRVIGPS